MNNNRDYSFTLKQVEGLLSDEENIISNLANISAVLKNDHNFFWVGFYLVEGNELVLGPFQGPVACTRITRGRGVCGKAWERGESILVPDVHNFPDHIACSEISKSEIVLPVFRKDGSVMAVLDIDSDRPDDFNSNDMENLEKVVLIIQEKHGR